MLQTRDYSDDKDTVFAATVAVLMDTGYRIQSADLASGLITANATSLDRVRLDLRGLVTTRQMPIASAFIEELPTGSRVRVNFSIGETATSLPGAGERAVRDNEPYRIFFDQLTAELVGRQAEHVVVGGPPADGLPRLKSPASEETEGRPEEASLDVIDPATGTIQEDHLDKIELTRRPLIDLREVTRSDSHLQSQFPPALLPIFSC